MLSFLSGKANENFRDTALIATTLVAVIAAGKVVDTLVRKWIAKTAGWFQKEIKDIIKGELVPITESIAEATTKINANSASRVRGFEYTAKALLEIKDIVSTLTPNDGSHLHDTIVEIDANIKTLLPNEGK